MDDSGRASGRALALARDAFERGDGDAAHRPLTVPASRRRRSGRGRRAGPGSTTRLFHRSRPSPLQPVGMGPHSLQR